MDTLAGRLSAGPWQVSMASSGVQIFQRNMTGEDGVIQVIAVEARDERAARIIVSRMNGRVTYLTPEQEAAWAERIVTACAASVRSGQPLSPESFAPYFKLADRQSADTMTLDETPGNPGGVLLINGRRSGNVCMLTIATGGVPALHRALINALTARGAAPERFNNYRLRDPEGGRDALFMVTSEHGPLMVRVR